jgi:hypothetical protein
MSRKDETAELRGDNVPAAKPIDPAVVRQLELGCSMMQQGVDALRAIVAQLPDQAGKAGS